MSRLPFRLRSRSSARGYTLVELAVAAFATLLMVTAMVRWTFDVASTGQQVLSGRDDLALQAAFLLLESDLAAATFCGEPQLSARLAHVGPDRLLLPAVRSDAGGSDGLWRVEWRLDGAAELSLQRVAVPVVQPHEVTGVSCREASSPVSGLYEFGTLASGLGAGSSFLFLQDGSQVAPGGCAYESQSGCAPQTLQVQVFDGGELFLRRSFLAPAAR